MTKNSPSANSHAGLALHRIGEAARMIGVSRETLRVWEKKGLVRSRRSPGGYRLYSLEDIAHVANVRHWRTQGVNLAGIESLLARADNEKPAKPAETATPFPEARYLGRKLRQLRLSGRMSLTQASRLAGLSASFLSLIERGLATPSVSSLRAVCKALGTTVGALLGESESSDGTFVRRECRRSLPSMDPGICIEQLAGGKGLLDCQLFTLGPGRASAGSYVHQGEEFVLVLRGMVEITLDELRTYVLRAGDSACFASTRPHAWRNPGRRSAKVLWINTDPGAVNASGRNATSQWEAR